MIHYLVKIRRQGIVLGVLFFGLSGALVSCSKKHLEQAPQSSLNAPDAGFTSSTLLSPKEKNNFYRWLFKEMHQQVFNTDKVSPADASAWVNVLSQGASIEGVYHGLVLSVEFQKLENRLASPGALRFFAEEAILLKSKSESLSSEEKVQQEELIKKLLNASLYSFKRELGELVLKQLDERESNRQDLAAWYAKTAVRWSQLNIDFGLPQRNLKDLEFHRAWAMANSFGLIQWELLNRMHRVFNHFGEAAPGKK